MSSHCNYEVANSDDAGRFESVTDVTKKKYNGTEKHRKIAIEVKHLEIGIDYVKRWTDCFDSMLENGTAGHGVQKCLREGDMPYDICDSVHYLKWDI